MSITEYIFIAIWTAFMLWTIYMLIRNEFTFRTRQTINHAIFLYRKQLIENRQFDYEVDWDDMREYDNIMWRFWDWSQKQALPPEKFEIIKPYIEKGKR